MNINQMKSSRFLKKEDCGAGILVTINGDVTQENVAAEGAGEELKYCLHFHETDKPLVLNSTNNQVIAKICGSEDTENWDGKKIVLYNDPNVGYAGKITGGVRARAPKNAAAQAPSKAAPVETSDDAPF